MAKKATIKDSGKNSSKPKKSVSSGKRGTSVVRVASTGGRGGSRADAGMGDAFIKLLQSPLVAELVAVAATAALGGAGRTGLHQRRRRRGKRAGKAVKEAGKAAAAAVGRRLGTEMDEIRKAAKGGAKA